MPPRVIEGFRDGYLWVGSTSESMVPVATLKVWVSSLELNVMPTTRMDGAVDDNHDSPSGRMEHATGWVKHCHGCRDVSLRCSPLSFAYWTPWCNSWIITPRN